MSNAESWAIGAGLEITQACTFPTATKEAADPGAKITWAMIQMHTPLTLWAGDRATLVRVLDKGRHLLCRHASGPLFIARTERFSLIP